MVSSIELKSQDQLDVQALSRVWSQLVGARTTLINQESAILLKRGIMVARRRRQPHPA